MKRLKPLMLLVIIISMMPFSVSAHTRLSGSAGEGVTWEYNGDLGELVLSGEGEIKDYTLASKTPWYSVSDGIKTVKVYDGITKIGANAFGELKNLDSVFLGEDVRIIGEEAFMNSSSMGTLYIYGNIEETQTGAFYGCNDLRRIVFGKNVTLINPLVFKSAKGAVIYDVNAQNLNYCSEDGVVFLKDKSQLVMYPCGLSGGYTVPDTTQKIGDYAFYNATKMTEVVIGDNVKTIGDYAFAYCIMLENIKLSNNAENLGEFAFADCVKLKSITLPCAKTIPCGLLSGCEAVKELTIPDCVENIGDYAFYGMDMLSELTISENARKIGNFAITGCYNLNRLTIPVSVKEIGKQAFWFENGIPEIRYKGSENDWNEINGESNIRLWFKILHTDKDIIFEK